MRTGGRAHSGRRSAQAPLAAPPAVPELRAETDRRLPGLSTRLYLPALVVVAIAVALVGIGWWQRFWGGDYAGELASLRVVVVGPASLALVGLFLVVERLRPAQQRPLIARGHRQDLLWTVFNAVLVVPFVAALSLSFALLAVRVAPWIVLPAGHRVPRWAVTGLIVVAMDACNWLAHLANHRVRAMWRFHELHHSQEDMSVLTVFRTHPLIHVSYLIALVPAIVLLANGAVSTALLVAYAAMVAFAHSNTNLSFGPLDRVFVSPNFHRIHHRLDGAQDVNLGFALSVWDQLAGRAVWVTGASVRADTGLPGRPLAVEQAGERPQHLRVFAAQLIGPFRPWNEQGEPSTSHGRRHRGRSRPTPAGRSGSRSRTGEAAPADTWPRAGEGAAA